MNVRHVSLVLVAVAGLASFSAPRTVAASGKDDEFDLLFFGSEVPVLLRIVLESSRVSIGTVRERFVSVLLDAFDTDRDGQLSPEEARRISWGDLTFDESEHDLSKDDLAGKVETTFGPKFLVRRKAPLLVQSVQLHSRLDANGDSHISRDELTHGVASLRHFDFDDDETLSPAELQPFPQSMLDAAMNPEAEGDSRVFVVLEESEDLDKLADRMIRTYGKGGSAGLAQTVLGISELGFSSLDDNSDALLDRSELVSLLNRPRPHVEIRVNFRRRRVEVKVMSAGEERVVEQESPARNRLSVRLGGETVEFSATDNRYQAGDHISFLRIEFRRQDADKNSYLDPAEFAQLGNIGATFENVDLNEDGRVLLEELDRFIRLDAYRSQSFAEMTVDAIDKPLFQILDENIDRRLTQKEFAAGIERMRPYDRDGDGTLAANELQALRKYRVAFSFGVPPVVRIDRQSRMMADRRLPIMRPQGEGPGWFRKMDRNQDGDLTWREFLGPRPDFERLDRDGNGWIDAEEAAEESGE